MAKKRTKHSAAFKAKVALEAVKEQDTVAAIARRHKLHPNVVYKWKSEMLDNLSAVFERESKPRTDSDREAELLQKIGELTVERDFLSKGLGSIR